MLKIGFYLGVLPSSCLLVYHFDDHYLHVHKEQLMGGSCLSCSCVCLSHVLLVHLNNDPLALWCIAWVIIIIQGTWRCRRCDTVLKRKGSQRDCILHPQSNPSSSHSPETPFVNASISGLSCELINRSLALVVRLIYGQLQPLPHPEPFPLVID